MPHRATLGARDLAIRTGSGSPATVRTGFAFWWAGPTILAWGRPPDPTLRWWRWAARRRGRPRLRADPLLVRVDGCPESVDWHDVDAVFVGE